MPNSLLFTGSGPRTPAATMASMQYGGLLIPQSVILEILNHCGVLDFFSLRARSRALYQIFQSNRFVWNRAYTSLGLAKQRPTISMFTDYMQYCGRLTDDPPISYSMNVKACSGACEAKLFLSQVKFTAIETSSEPSIENAVCLILRDALPHQYFEGRGILYKVSDLDRSIARFTRAFSPMNIGESIDDVVDDWMQNIPETALMQQANEEVQAWRKRYCLA
ncbi:hypothetical protein Hypma_001365 [Hypsizygus marmoreus]|uniref:F-box domain-containing protein n=1 Tax=Hypsizygus marmoreus TaxID=39966 RepID=A0A369K3L2_HYPMA|nr:hypothetical protein Hypma_001365 [Hypsizygus marmoreus]